MSFTNQSATELFKLGNNIHALRQYRNYSLKYLAKLSKYDRTCLSNIEKGVQNLELNSAMKIAKALDIAFPLLFSSDLGSDPSKAKLQPYFADDFLLVFTNNFKKNMLRLRRDHLYVYTQSGVHETIISRIITGVEKNPTIFTLIAMAHACSSDLETMFSRNM